jgi:hypothetical protein
MSSHQNALNELIDGGVAPSHAQAILALAAEYNCVHFPNLRPGPDSWGSTIELTVQHLYPPAPPNTFMVKFKERTHY